VVIQTLIEESIFVYEYTNQMSILVNSLHIGLFAPALLMLAWYPKWNGMIVQMVLALTALAVLWYHGKKALVSYGWVSWFHVLVVAPLLLLLAW
jgi:hypothetical protein